MNKAHHPTVFSDLSKLEDHRNFIYTAGNSTGVVGYVLVCTVITMPDTIICLQSSKTRLLPKKNFKKPTRSKAEKLRAQHVKCSRGATAKNLGAGLFLGCHRLPGYC